MLTNAFSRSLMVFLICGAMIVSCASIEYSDDSSFLVSAQAESPEFPVFLNGKACVDMDGTLGMCARRIRSTDTLVVHMDPSPYSYTLKLACPSSMGLSKSYPVPKGQAFDLGITQATIGALVLFVCRGEITPDDRPEPVSAFWQFMVDVVDKKYNAREVAYMTKQDGKNLLVLGQHAKYSRVFDGEWKEYQEEPVVEIKGDPSLVRAYSESYNMRFNSVGF